MPRRFALSTAPHQKTSVWKKHEPVSWAEFVEMLKLDNPRQKKDCGGHFLGELIDQLKRSDTIVSRSAITLDADNAGPAFITDVAVELSGTSLVFHTTFSHKPDEPRYRVLIPLDRDVEPVEFSLITKALMYDLGEEQFDAGCAQPYRMMHFPASNNPSQFEYKVIKGRPLNADDWLARADELGIKVDPEVEIRRDTEYDDKTPPTKDQLSKAAAVLAKACRDIATLGESERFDPFLGRNDACIHWLPTLYRFVIGGCLTEEQVDTAVYAACMEAPGDASFGEEEFRSVSASAWAYANKDGGQRPIIEEEDYSTELFEASPVLKHIHQAALSRMVGPEGLLAYIIARVLVEVPPQVHLPPVIVSPAALNFAVAAVGGSGAGKSGLLAVSRDLLGFVGYEQLDLERNLGSGEGIAETFLKPEVIPNELTGKLQSTKRKVLIDEPKRILLVDEVDNLKASSGRQGATVAPVLRSALTGEPLGQENANDENKRHVPAGSYRLVFLIGVQPSRSSALIGREVTDAGTPQRFLWAPADDTKPPDEDVDWPGELEWSVPYFESDEIEYPGHIKKEIRDARRKQMKGEGSPLSGHQYLTRLKVATGLALLHGETKINDRWWELAHLMIKISIQQQQVCLRALGMAGDIESQVRGKHNAIARIAEEEVYEKHNLKRIARNLRKKLTPEWRGMNKVKKDLPLKDRPFAEAAAELLVSAGLAEIEDHEHNNIKGKRLRGVGG